MTFKNIGFAALTLASLSVPALAQHPKPPTRENGMYDMTGWSPVPVRTTTGNCSGEATCANMVYGFDWLSNGDMVLLTNDYIGHDQKPASRATAKVSIISGFPNGPFTARTIASHFKQPGGIKVVNDKIWVSDMDTVYVIPNNTPAPTDTSTNRTARFRTPLSTDYNGHQAPFNFQYNKATCGSGLTGCTSTNSQAHHYIFTPVYYQGKFYASYGASTGHNTGLANLNSSSFYAGAILVWDSTTTQLDTIANRSFAGGLRSPNGTALGPEGSIFVTDHQGSYLPMNTLTLYKVGAPRMLFGGYRQAPTFSANFAQAWYDRGAADYVPPVAVNRYDQGGKNGWVGIAQPYYLTLGPYAGQVLVGDINSRGLWRVALDTLPDTTGAQNVQGAVFYFTPGASSSSSLQIGTRNSGNNRITQGPDGTIYAGGGRGVGNWASGAATDLIYVFKPKASPSQFEILSIRSLADGYELLLNKKVNPSTVHKSKFNVGQRNWVRQAAYGTGFLPANSGSGGTTQPAQFTARTIDSVQVSLDSLRIRLKVSGIKRINQERRGDSVTHWHTRFLFDSTIASTTGEKIYTTEADYAQNWISARTWNGGSVLIDTSTTLPPDTTDTTGTSLRPQVGRLADNVWFSRSPGVIRVNVDNMTRAYNVTLRDLTGRTLFRSGEVAPATRAVEIKAPAATQSVYTIEVNSGREAYRKIVTF